MIGLRSRILGALAGAATVTGVVSYVCFSAGQAGEARTALVAVGLGLGVLGLAAFLVARAAGSLCRCLTAECTRLADALQRGDLSFHSDAASVIPELRPVLASLDTGIASVAAPVAEIRNRLERLSHGDLPERRAVAYQGDLAALSEALDQVTAAVESCVAEIAVLASKAFSGKLSERADPLRHEGDFRIVTEGLNATLDVTLTPVLEALRVLERLAHRDLTARVEADYAGDHAHLKDSANSTARQLQDALHQVATAVKQVNAAAGEIASSAHAVAEGASSQASSLEETASQLESISSTTRQVSKGAEQTAALAAQAKAAASEGAAAVAAMTSTMASIQQSTQGTAQIIKDINEIAFQTNLLALNAAVEAARAGAAGRGFAVVAEEVRALAQRSKVAAAKTENLISTSLRQAQAGEEKARLVDAQFQAIASHTGKVTEIAGELAAAAHEQAAGIEQLNKAVALVGNVTQQNAASSEQSSSAASELSSQSEGLADLVGSFRLESGSATGETDAITSLSQQIKAAVAAHGMWKTHLVAAITTGSATVKVEDAGHDDRCKFGKWLHGTTALRSMHGFDEIKALHAQFHRLAAEVLRLALVGKKDEARRLMDSTSEYTRTSAELTQKLTAWAGAAASAPPGPGGTQPSRNGATARASASEWPIDTIRPAW